MSVAAPPPDAAALAASHQLTQVIRERIAARGGWLPFIEYMDLALYLPMLGYYAGGAEKLGPGGDFYTAPELTPLFGQSLARQAAQVLNQVQAAGEAPRLLEAGAGSGRLLIDLLESLEELGLGTTPCDVLELSGELRARQQQLIESQAPRLLKRITWLDELPSSFSGCVIANELLDAMPAHAVSWREGEWLERGVAATAEGFTWEARPAAGAVALAMQALPATPPHDGEIGLAARAWTAEWGRRLHCGAVLLLDYGLPAHELYHPQRSRGALRCYHRQKAHDDPFWLPGLSDITCHVDFTAIAEAGFDAGLDVLGYTTQANFLINCGIGELLAQRREAGGEQALRAAGAVRVLLTPAEMGELFKVLALGRGIDAPLCGFTRGDRRHAL